MKELVSYIVSELVEDKEGFSISVEPGRGEKGEDIINIYVPKSDIGRVIGKEGRIAKAIRTLVRAASMRVGGRYVVEILEKD